MFLRSFAPTDLGEIMRTVAETFMQDYSPSFYLSLHGYWPDGFVVASDRGKIVGFALGAISEPEEARILVMAVERKRRGRGLGTAILNEFLARCGLMGIRKVVLEVRVSNVHAREFYSKRGFQYLGLLQKYYLNGEDGVKMVRWI